MNGYSMKIDPGPGYNEALNIISRMSVDELTKIISSEHELTQVVSNLSEVKHLETAKRNLEESIKRLAERNMGKKPVFDREKQKLSELHHELGQRKAQLQALRGNQDDEDGDSNPDVVLALMQSAAVDLERETEQMAEDFFDGIKTEEEVTDFERRFVEDRKKAHELKIKAEKFHELLQMSKSTSYLHSNQHYRS